MTLTIRGAALTVRAIPEANNYTSRAKGELVKMQDISILDWRGRND